MRGDLHRRLPRLPLCVHGRYQTCEHTCKHKHAKHTYCLLHTDGTCRSDTCRDGMALRRPTHAKGQTALLRRAGHGRGRASRPRWVVRTTLPQRPGATAAWQRTSDGPHGGAGCSGQTSENRSAAGEPRDRGTIKCGWRSRLNSSCHRLGLQAAAAAMSAIAPLRDCTRRHQAREASWSAGAFG